MKNLFFFVFSSVYLFLSPLEATDKFANRPFQRFSPAYYKNTYFPSQELLKVEILLNGHSLGVIAGEETLNNSEAFEETLNNSEAFPQLSHKYLEHHWRKIGLSKGWLGSLPTLDLDQHYETYFSSEPGLIEESLLQNKEQLSVCVNAEQIKKWPTYEQARHDYLIHHFIQLRNQYMSEHVIHTETPNYPYYKTILDHPLPSDFNEGYYFAFFYENNLALLDEDIRSKANDFGLNNAQDRLQHPFEGRLLRSAFLERHCRGYTLPRGDYARIYTPSFYKIDFTSRLKNLNPFLSDFLAETWVDYAGTTDRLASAVDSLKNSPLTLETQGKLVELYPYPVPQNEFCLFSTLGLSPDSFQKIMLDKTKKNTHYLIAATMYKRLLADSFPEPLKTDESNLSIQYLRESEDERQKKVDEINSLFQTNHTFNDLVTLPDFKNFRGDLRQLDYACLLYEKGLIKWCEREYVINKFLSYELENISLKPDSEGNYLSCFPLSMFAESLNKNLIIYKKNPLSHRLEIFYKHEPQYRNEEKDPLPEVHHIFFSGYYCQPLYENPTRFNIPNMKAARSLLVDKSGAAKSYTDNDILIVSDLINKIIGDLQPKRPATEAKKQHYSVLKYLEIENLNRLSTLEYEDKLNTINNLFDPILKNIEKELKKYAEEAVNTFTSKYLIKKIEENPEYKEKIKFIDIDSVLEELGIRNPIVIKPNHVLQYTPQNLDEIIQDLEKTHNWIEIRDDGIYATQDEDLYPRRIVDFAPPPPIIE